MATTQRSVPRFLPTLTEVVHVELPLPEPVPDPALVEAERREAVGVLLRAQLQAALESRLTELVEDVVAAAMVAQVDVITERLRGEIDALVRETLDASVVNEADQAGG